MTRSELLARADTLRSGRTPFVLATVVRAERPTSAKPGDCALVLPDGSIEGFVGGSCAESTVRREGLRLMRIGESTLLRISPSAGDAGTLSEGLVAVSNPCLSGGTLEIFLETMLPPMLVQVFGDAPVAMALGQLGAALGYDVHTGTEAGTPIPPDASAVVVASHGRDEEAVLLAALRTGVPYIGLVASTKRGNAVVASLDVKEAARTRIRTPAGLRIGARTPQEIALSILAEIVERRPHAEPPSTQDSPTVVDHDAVDPVCGMTVAVSEESLRLELAGTTWYFCGSGCRQAFTADPPRYAAHQADRQRHSPPGG